MTAQHTRSKSLSSSGSSSPEITEDVCNCGQIVGNMWARGRAAESMSKRPRARIRRGPVRPVRRQRVAARGSGVKRRRLGNCRLQSLGIEPLPPGRRTVPLSPAVVSLLKARGQPKPLSGCTPGANGPTTAWCSPPSSAVRSIRATCCAPSSLRPARRASMASACIRCGTAPRWPARGWGAH
jgi:hypothetical protein